MFELRPLTEKEKRMFDQDKANQVQAWPCMVCQHQEICMIKENYKTLRDRIDAFKLPEPNAFSIRVTCKHYLENKPTQR